MPESRGVTVTTPSECELAVARFVAAPRERVFAAWTRPELVTQWLSGLDTWHLAVCRMDPRPGGELRWEWHGADGEVMGLSGTFREVTPPERIVHTELFDEDWTGGETLVTVVLDEVDGGTMMTMTVRYSSPEARDGAMATDMAEGMEMGYVRLERLLGAG